MTTELSARMALQGGLRFIGTDNADYAYAVHLDTIGAAGGVAALTPLELLLISLASCSALDVITILRTQQQLVDHMEIYIRRQRCAELPTICTAIDLEYSIRGINLDRVAAERAIELSCDWYGAVWAVIGSNVPIRSALRSIYAASVFALAN